MFARAGICLERPLASCVQELLFSLPVVALVAVWIICSLPIPWPAFIRKPLAWLASPFLPTLTVSEAEQLDVQFAQQDASQRGESSAKVTELVVSVSRWRAALLIAFSGIELAGWSAIAVYNLVQFIQHNQDIPFSFFPWTPFLVTFTWAYSFIRTLHRPPVTPPYDLFILYILYISEGAYSLGYTLYASSTYGLPLPSDLELTATGIHLAILLSLLLVIFSLPLNVRRFQVDSDDKLTPTPEDYTSLAGWALFSWVNPLVSFRNIKRLEDEDVWDLSSTLKTRPNFHIFTQTPGSRLLWRLIRANSMDIIIDFVLTEVSMIFDFAGPFFLQRILDELEYPKEGSRQRLYIYATLGFLANCVKAEADLQHLWYGRRAASRIGSQLSAAVYDKATRIVDPSGSVDKKAEEKQQDKADKADDKKDKTTPAKDAEEDESGASVGKIVNIMGIDARKLQDQVITMSMLYSAPFQLVLSCIYLYSLLGWSAFAGFLPLLLSVPLSKLLADAVSRIQKSLMSAKDKRMKLIDEMFGSVKFIKFFAWEEKWIAKIIAARMVEMKFLRRARLVNVLYSLLWVIVPNMVSVLSFLVFILSGHKLTVSVAFTAIRLFDMLRQPMGILPYALITFSQTKVSLGRLAEFFNVEEVPDNVFTPARPVTKDPQELLIENANFKWSSTDKKAETDKPAQKPSHTLSSSEVTVVGDAESVTASTSTRTVVGGGEATFELRDITIKLAEGKLTVVTGPTASGKTALLLALLGEMNQVSGTVIIPKNPSIVNENGLRNSISYAAQTPWLQQMSIKDNIIFEYPFDKERYDAVVEACALKPDFRALEDGDMTEIGAKGVSLSGGQKARVALARAVYAPTQYVVLDDIFSAVDSHTARFLFERLLKGSLLAHRTVILVTHHVELVLPGTHYLIQMSGGRIEHQGTVADLKQRGLLDLIAHDPSIHSEEEKKTEKVVDAADPSQSDTGPAKQARKLVEEEERSEGRVKWSIYKTFMKASSYWTWVAVLVLIVLTEACEIGTRVWMSIWGTAYQQSTFMTIAYSVLSFSKEVPKIFSDPLTSIHYDIIAPKNTTFQVAEIKFPNANENPLFYVAIYTALGIFSALLTTVGEWVLLTGSMRSGMVLFRQLLSKLSTATFRFFDITPTGRILNRFGKDFETLDGQLAYMLYHVTTSVASFIGAVVTVVYVVPYYSPIAFVLAFVYYRWSVRYLNTGRDLRRMESTARSPILAGFSDLVSGIITVRAFSVENDFLRNHFKRVDTSQRFWYFSWMLNRWLLLRFDILGAVSVFAATILVISGYVPVGYAALTIVSAMTFSMSVYWTCRAITELELSLNSVERVVEYLDVPQEPSPIVEKNRVPAYWPSSSDSDSMLVVEKLEVKYAPELPSVLHEISFSLKARERVGLLGRTGCGKSTLAMSLLRFVEPTKGKIIIDGIDITTIGTQDLRSRVTFIPQDATLFAGTVRENLDPFNEHEDADCLDALARVHLITANSQKSSRAPSIHSAEDGSTTPTSSEADSKVVIRLDSPVAAGGHNFSNGQRQLLAMARALLRQSGVVILDEATSSIDKAADVKIQTVIREEFDRSLLLTIAHRLGTIIDYDRLIVLDKGRIAEFDTPWNLINKEGGIFREMCLQSGTYAELEAAAKVHAESTGAI